MSGKRREKMDMGHDAFLDIVANLVGILIILVVVLGTQTQRVAEWIEDDEADSVIAENMDTPAPEISEIVQPATATEDQVEELSRMAYRAKSAAKDSVRLERQISSIDREVEATRQARGKLLDLVSLAEQAWEEKRKDLDEEKVAKARLNSKIKQASNQLATLAGTKERLENQKAPVIAVEHLPTPMAKTVFGDEIHFHLRDDHLALVPLEMFLEEVRESLSRSGTNQGVSTSAVGPMRGFVGHYAIEKSVRRGVNREGRLATVLSARMAALVIEPLNEPVGTHIDQVVSGPSFLDVELAGRDPATTTVTVWVYPNSFASLRRLKEHLYARGFATAARPLPMSRRITVSPRGSRSRAQ